MHHDTFGEITREGDTGDWIGAIEYGARQVKRRICAEGETFETMLILAGEVVRRLDELDAVGKRVAVTDLRDTYNNGWNEYDEAQPDGSLKAISNSQLSEVEFEKKLSLNAINLVGDQMITFFYDDENMFWGHSVLVTSLNGLDFSEAYAELFG